MLPPKREERGTGSRKKTAQVTSPTDTTGKYVAGYEITPSYL